jgi:hypothetical protein
MRSAALPAPVETTAVQTSAAMPSHCTTVFKDGLAGTTSLGTQVCFTSTVTQIERKKFPTLRRSWHGYPELTVVILSRVQVRPKSRRLLPRCDQDDPNHPPLQVGLRLLQREKSGDSAAVR